MQCDVPARRNDDGRNELVTDAVARDGILGHALLEPPTGER